MFSLFSTPDWFNGIDLVFDSIVLVIALLVAGYSWKVYKTTSENKFGYFSLAFGLISLSFVFKLITHGVLYSGSLQVVADNVVSSFTAENNIFNDLLYRLGFFMQMSSMLGAWLLIFLISQKSRDRLKRFHELSQIGLFVYLILLLSLVSNFKYEIFYLTSMVILSITVLNYYKNYLNSDKNKNALIVLNSFFIIFLSQLFFLFMFLWDQFYFIGELLLLIGFLMILYVYRRIIHS